MPVSMYTVSIPIFIQHLNGLNAVLDKATAWAAGAQGQRGRPFEHAAVA
jgi:hypothetical protein